MGQHIDIIAVYIGDTDIIASFRASQLDALLFSLQERGLHKSLRRKYDERPIVSSLLISDNVMSTGVRTWLSTSQPTLAYNVISVGDRAMNPGRRCCIPDPPSSCVIVQASRSTPHALVQSDVTPAIETRFNYCYNSCVKLTQSELRSDRK